MHQISHLVEYKDKHSAQKALQYVQDYQNLVQGKQVETRLPMANHTV